jgi:hypothetical protein
VYDEHGLLRLERGLSVHRGILRRARGPSCA